MFKLLVLLYAVTLYAHYNIFKQIKKKPEQDLVSHVRSLEDFKAKYMKVQVDIKFINYARKKILYQHLQI